MRWRCRARCGLSETRTWLFRAFIIQDLRSAVGEAGGILATFLFLFFMPYGSAQFWLTLAALAGLLAMQAVFWLITQPVNRFWLQGQKLGRMGSEFFSVGVKRSPGNSEPQPV